MRLGKLFYYDGALIDLQSPCHPACNHFLLSYLPRIQETYCTIRYIDTYSLCSVQYGSILPHESLQKENSAAHRSRVIGTHPTIFHMIRVGSPYNPGPNLLSGKIIWSTWGHDQQWRSGIPTNVRLLGTWCGRGFLGDLKENNGNHLKHPPKENS